MGSITYSIPRNTGKRLNVFDFGEALQTAFAEYAIAITNQTGKRVDFWQQRRDLVPEDFYESLIRHLKDIDDRCGPTLSFSIKTKDDGAFVSVGTIRPRDVWLWFPAAPPREFTDRVQALLAENATGSLDICDHASPTFNERAPNF